MASSSNATAVAAVRHFNRFYTRLVGALDEHLLRSDWSLTEVRVMYELSRAGEHTPTSVARTLRLDPGYLTRILRRLESAGLLSRRVAKRDGRSATLALTAKGKRIFAALDARSSDEVANLIAPLSADDRRRLVGAMHAIESVLDARPATADGTRPRVTLRAPEPGDYGWVVQRHGVLYAKEYGWDHRFESLVAGIVGDFAREHDPVRERCWIADLGGRPVGSIFLVRQDDDVAKLRLLLVEPDARGFGIGARLVDECVRTARELGYRRMTLWTNDVLTSARRLYEQQGFQLMKSEVHRRFGPELVGQTWDLSLR